MKKVIHLPLPLQQAILTSLHHHLSLARHHFSQPLLEPTICWQQRGTVAGSARLNDWQIRLNPILCQENQSAFINEVVPHELAHLLVWKKFGRVAPHGKEWQWMMEQVLGVAARRTHNFATDSVVCRTWPYHCLCQQHQLTVRRHNKVVRQQSEYRCKHCRHLLQPGQLTGATTAPD